PFLNAPERSESSGLPEAAQTRVRSYKPAYSWEPHPFAPYQMANNNANIRGIKGRIAQLSKRAEIVAAAEASGQESKTTECAGYKVVENVVENRGELGFPGKPSAAGRAAPERD